MRTKNATLHTAVVNDRIRPHKMIYDRIRSIRLHTSVTPYFLTISVYGIRFSPLSLVYDHRKRCPFTIWVSCRISPYTIVSDRASSTWRYKNSLIGFALYESAVSFLLSYIFIFSMEMSQSFCMFVFLYSAISFSLSQPHIIYEAETIYQLVRLTKFSYFFFFFFSFSLEIIYQVK